MKSPGEELPCPAGESEPTDRTDGAFGPAPGRTPLQQNYKARKRLNHLCLLEFRPLRWVRPNPSRAIEGRGRRVSRQEATPM
jgi:hypothetical protein